MKSIKPINSRRINKSESSRITKIPLHIVYGMGVPTGFADYCEALDFAREQSTKPWQNNEEIKVFDSMLGKFIAIYKNGNLIS